MFDAPVYRSPYNPGIPELNELPEIKDATTKDSAPAGYPSRNVYLAMPGGSLEDLYGTDYRQDSSS